MKKPLITTISQERPTTYLCWMLKLLKWLVLFPMLAMHALLGACSSISGTLPTPDVSDTMKRFPYLAKNGLYGYANEQLALIIPAQYRSASLFTSTGFAVVADEYDRHGVIDTNGDLVVPLNYKSVDLHVVGKYTLAWTERTYTNSLRFWEWKFLPGFFSPSDNRLFDTEIKRAHLRMTVLETGQQVFSARVGGTYSRYPRIEPLDETHFIWEGNLFELGARRCRIAAKYIFGQLDDGSLLQRVANQFRVVDREGKPVAKPTYRYLDTLRYRIDDTLYRTHLLFTDGYQDRVAQVFGDERGNRYVFPDFEKSFPMDIAPWVHDTLAADSLIGKASLVGSISGTDRFIFRWYNRSTDAFEHWTLDTAGNWHGDIPEGNSFSVTARGTGQILWPRIDTVIPPEAAPEGWRLGSYRRVGTNTPLFEVTLRKENEQRMGVWDSEQERWVWQPAHRYIRCLSAEHGYWTFQPRKGGKYGLYHLPTGQERIAPRYHDMNAEGMVGYYDELHHYSRFYVDWDTQREYREK